MKKKKILDMGKNTAKFISRAYLTASGMEASAMAAQVDAEIMKSINEADLEHSRSLFMNGLTVEIKKLSEKTELNGRDVVKICAKRMRELHNRHYPPDWIEKDLKKLVEDL